MSVLQLRLRSAARVAGTMMRTEPLSVAVVVIAAAVGYWRLLEWSDAASGRWSMVILHLALLLMVHAGRRDERFLRTAGVPHRWLFRAEYLLILLPFTVPLLLSPSPGFAGFGVAAALLLPLLPTGLIPNILRQRIQRLTPIAIPLPAASFEWIGGVRRSAVGVLCLHTFALLFWRQPVVLGAVLLLLVLSPPIFYVDAEGSTLVAAFGLSPARFLRYKVSRSVALLWVLAAPVAALFLLVHPVLWHVPLLMLGAGSVVLAGSVLIKYAVYREGHRASFAVPIGVWALALSLVVPPLTALLLYRLWKQSVHNLRSYLYAFD